MKLSVPSPTDAWISKVGGRRANAELRTVGPEGIELPKGTFLVSFLGRLKGGDTVHAGSVLLRSGSQTCTATPVRYQPKRDGTSYMQCTPIRDAGYVATAEGGEDLTAELEKGAVDVPDYNLYTQEAYHALCDGQTDGGVALETLERQCMLLFPTTLIPGAAGIPGMVAYPPNLARHAVQSVAAVTSDVNEQLRLLGGTFIKHGARWVDERADDTGPAQMKLMRGDDCDGLSVSARGLMHSIGKHCADTPVGARLRNSTVLLVAGTATLQGKVQAHMWVAVIGRSSTVNCECTAVVRDEAHFRRAAYAWTTSACYVIMGNTKEYTLDNKLHASGALKAALAKAYYHVILDDGSYADRTTGAA